MVVLLNFFSEISFTRLIWRLLSCVSLFIVVFTARHRNVGYGYHVLYCLPFNCLPEFGVQVISEFRF